MEKIRIAVDAMGGDNAPAAPVAGAVHALMEQTELELILLGDEAAIKAEIKKTGYSGNAIRIIHCTETIAMAESPVVAIKTKKDSSMVKGLMLVRRGEAEAFVSAGSTGALLVGGQVLVGRIKGVERPPLGALMPTEEGFALLIDCGANVDARPQWLCQFAQMGSIYMKHAMKVENPRVAIINIGAEEEKGNALVKETFPLLKACKDINFIGSIEARDIPSGGADVMVTDAFSGNIIMKMYEGTATTLLRIIKGALKSTVPGMIGGALIKGTLKKALVDYDASKYGGAPLLGLNGLVVKAHGSAKEKEFGIAVEQCLQFYREDVNGKIRELMGAQAEEKRLKKKQNVENADSAGSESIADSTGSDSKAESTGSDSKADSTGSES